MPEADPIKPFDQKNTREMFTLLRSRDPKDRELFERRLAATPVDTARSVLIGPASFLVSTERTYRRAYVILLVAMTLSFLLAWSEGRLAAHWQRCVAYVTTIPLCILQILQSYQYRGGEDAILYFARSNDPRAVILLTKYWNANPRTAVEIVRNHQVAAELTRLLDELAEINYVNVPTEPLMKWIDRQYFPRSKKSSVDLSVEMAYVIAAALRFLKRHGNSADYGLIRSIAVTKQTFPNRAMVQEIASLLIVRLPKTNAATGELYAEQLPAPRVLNRRI